MIRLHEETFSCGQTKCESTVVNVLAPFTMQQILEELENFISDHKNLKLVPVLVPHFTPEMRVQTKVIEFHNWKGETADVLTTYTTNVLHKYKLWDKIIAFCGDKCNTNFGGAARRETVHVYAKIKISNLKINIQGIGCAAYILHNALQTSVDIPQLTLRP